MGLYMTDGNLVYLQSKYPIESQVLCIKSIAIFGGKPEEFVFGEMYEVTGHNQGPHDSQRFSRASCRLNNAQGIAHFMHKDDMQEHFISKPDKENP